MGWEFQLKRRGRLLVSVYSLLYLDLSDPNSLCLRWKNGGQTLECFPNVPFL
ncbi:hypothetical protein M758_11G049800 [Ceratodon purpureus]|nr:hypothetical protein M758_11G049800 [Ceratodon purpureus]